MTQAVNPDYYLVISTEASDFEAYTEILKGQKATFIIDDAKKKTKTMFGTPFEREQKPWESQAKWIQSILTERGERGENTAVIISTWNTTIPVEPHVHQFRYVPFTGTIPILKRDKFTHVAAAWMSRATCATLARLVLCHSPKQVMDLNHAVCDQPGNYILYDCRHGIADYLGKWTAGQQPLNLGPTNPSTSTPTSAPSTSAPSAPEDGDLDDWEEEGLPPLLRAQEADSSSD